MVKNVVFDLGGVLIEYDVASFLESLGYIGESAGKLRDIVFDNPLWNELDRGTYNFDDARSIMVAGAPELAEDIKLITGEKWYEILTEKKDSVEFLTGLKKEGYKIFFYQISQEKALIM